MAYRALYRVWRPKFFYELKGQEHITKVLLNQVKTGRIAHAYLFCGPRGTGKTSTAKILARAVNCEHPNDGEPCEDCPMCASVTSDSAVDIIEIDAASNNGVENIRDIREKVNLLPSNGRFKVYIIDEVHMLSAGAFNALLKTLEEPPGHVIFILATTEARKLPATILSRCQRFDFKRISAMEIAERLKEVSDAEGFAADEKAILMIARAAEGGLRDALSLMDQVSAMEGGITAANVAELLGGADRQELIKLAGCIAAYDIKGALLQFARLKDSGSDLGLLLKDLTGILRDMFAAEYLNAQDGFVSIYEDTKNLKEMAALMGKESLLRALEILIRSEQDLKYHTQPEIVLQTALIRVMTPEDDASPDLLARINKLEGTIEKLKKGAIAIQPQTVAPVQKAEAKREEKPVVKKAPGVHKKASEEDREAWKKVLAGIQKEKRYLYEAACDLVLTEISQDSIKLTCPAELSPVADQFGTDHSKLAIKKITAECLGRELALKIQVDDEEDRNMQSLMNSLGPDIEVME